MRWRPRHSSGRTDPTAELRTLLVQMIPIEQHGLVHDVGQRVRKEGSNPARAISNQQECTPLLQREQYDDQQLLQEHRARAAQIAITFCRDHLCRTHFPEVVRLRLPGEHLIDRNQHLIGSQLRPQMPELLFCR